MRREGRQDAGMQTIPSFDDRAQYFRVEPSQGFDLASFWRVLVRRRGLIVATVTVLTAASTAAIWSLAPRYSAEALLLVREHQPTLLDIQNAVRGNEPETSDSEIEILRSRRIAKLVVEKLDLTREASINPALEPEAWPAHLQRITEEALQPILARLTAWFPASETRPAQSPQAITGSPPPISQEDIALNRTADALLKHLVVDAKGRSRAVGVTFQATDPRLAAAVANAVVDSYVADQLNAKLHVNKQTTEWLSQRVAEIKQQVVNTDRLLQQRKVDAGITDDHQVALIQQQIIGLSEKMVSAHADTMLALARLEQAQQSQAPDATSETLNSPVIQKLREDQADLQRRATSARAAYGDKYPPVVRLQSELTDLNATIRREVGKIIIALRGDVATMQTREQLLTQSLDGLRSQAAQISGTAVDIAVLQHEADANRAIFDRLLSRAKEANVESGLQQADAEVIAHADVPEKATFPNKPLFVGIAFLASLAAAGLIVTGVESLDHGFHDLEEAENILGVRAIGFVPRLPRRSVPGTHLHTVERPLSAYTEAIRGLYTSLILSDAEHAPKRILITSSLAGEGKTSLSISLARLVALAGRKVLLIDCDLRRRDVSRLLGLRDS